MESLKRFGKNLLFLTLKVLSVFVYLVILIVPGIIIQDEFLIILWVCFGTLASIYIAILLSIASEKDKTIPYLQRLKSSVKDTNKKFFLGISIFLVFIAIALLSENETEKTQPSIPIQNTNSVSIQQPSKVTFYTNAISNVRICASLTCETAKQALLNTPITLEYSNIESMPEWVPLSWTEDNVLRNGFISKSVLSVKKTYSEPVYNPPSYGSNYHTNSDYKYNYRTGYSGNYDYNYDVSGSGDNGYTYGNVDTSGQYGEGYIYDEEGNEIYVETEWVDNGIMEATDEDGNTYELEVE